MFLLKQLPAYHIGLLQVIPSLTGSIRKKDEVEQRKAYDDMVIERHNLTDRGWYNGTRVLKNMKQPDKKTGQSDIQVEGSCKINGHS